MYFPLFVGVLCLYLFYYALLCVHSSFAIILKKKRKLVALLLVSHKCIVTIHFLRLFLTVPWVGLQCVIVVFPNHTHLVFVYTYISSEYSTVLPAKSDSDVIFCLQSNLGLRIDRSLVY